MENLPSLFTEITTLHADLCAALADPTRIMILYLLAEKPQMVGEMSARLNIPQPNTSRHLKTLRERGLVRANRQAQNVEYTLTDPRIIDALDTLRAVLRDSISQRANLLSDASPGD